MRRHDNVLWQLLHPCAMVCQDVQRVGIEHYWRIGFAHLCYERNGCSLALPQSRTDTYGINTLRIDSLRENIIFVVDMHNSLWNRHLQYVVVASRRVHRQFSNSTSQACLSCQHRCASHAVASSNKQSMPNRSLMVKVATLEKYLPNVALLYNVEL